MSEDRRGNGLTAASWQALADLDPRVADALLDALARRGIAAYAAPAQQVDPVTYAAARPRLRDRVFVDADAVGAAQEVLAAEHPEPAVDEEEAWRQIVAALQRDDAGGTPPWPAAEDLPGRVAAPVQPVTPPAPPAAPAAPAPPQPVEEEDEHFVPPPPPPLPKISTPSAFAAASIIAGALVLIVPAMTGDPAGSGLAVLAVLAILGGFVTLVLRMREGPPHDDGPDDGAVV